MFEWTNVFSKLLITAKIKLNNDLIAKSKFAILKSFLLLIWTLSDFLSLFFRFNVKQSHKKAKKIYFILFAQSLLHIFIFSSLSFDVLCAREVWDRDSIVCQIKKLSLKSPFVFRLQIISKYQLKLI